MPLTPNNFINAWSFGANDVVGIEIPQAPVNPNIGTYGFRSIGIPSITCAIGARGATYLTAVDSDPGRDNAEVLTVMQLKAGTTPAYGGVVVRGSGVAGAENGYLCVVNQGSNIIMLVKCVAGVATFIDALVVTMPAEAEDWYIRFRVNGTSLKLKAWRFDETEPAAWGVSAIDSDIAGAGFVGLGCEATAVNTMTFNTPGFISVGTNGETAPRPMSEIEQRNWFNNDSNPCVLIVKAGVLGQDISGNPIDSQVLASNWPFVTEGSDVPPNQVFDDVMVQAPTFTSKASEQITSGRSSQAYGDVIFNNEGGVRDHWLTWNWDGREFEMYKGGVGWRLWDFVRVLSATNGQIYVPKKDQIGLNVLDKSALLNRKVQDDTIGGTTANKGAPVPITMGHVFNVKPVLTDGATFRYKYHDESIAGAVGIEEVRDSGDSVAFTDQGNGEFTLNASPTNGSEITMDVNIDVSAGSSIRAGNRHSRALQTIVENRAGFGTSSCYVGARNGSLALFGADPTDEIGIYMPDAPNMVTLLDMIALSPGGFWYFNRLGIFCASLLRVPVAQPGDPELIEDDITGFKVDKIILPSDPQQLGYLKNWNPQTSGFVGIVSVADRALFSAEAQWTTELPSHIGLDRPVNHELRERPRNRATLMYNQTDAIAEVNRLDSIFSKTCALVSFETKVNAVYYNLGDTLTLTYSRFGFEQGKAGIILGLEENFAKGSVRITLFVQLTAQFPVTTSSEPYVTAADFY
jgi:hypothetical protein